MSSLSKSSGMGFLLDSAVKNAVSHLASSNPHPLQAHEVHQTDFIEPDYEEYTYRDYKDYKDYKDYRDFSYSTRLRPYHRRVAPPERRQGSLLSDFGRFLPLLIAVPIIAAASYYLVILNGPTPVVKERSEDSRGENSVERILRLVLSSVEQS